MENNIEEMIKVIVYDFYEKEKILKNDELWIDYDWYYKVNGIELMR